MVYTRATWQFGGLSAGKGRAFRALGRWLPGSPGEDTATLCEQQGQCLGLRGRVGPGGSLSGHRSPRCSLPGPEQPRDRLTCPQVAIQSWEPEIQPWHFPQQWRSSSGDFKHPPCRKASWSKPCGCCGVSLQSKHWCNGAAQMFGHR